ncbi:MAG: hypothetical protein KC465_02345, partial [Planktomarina temperata]|nr:hypothetical protein [Planktomarina temperata]
MGQSFKRKVFYIPGYDPIHPRRYRELYRAESAAQAAISGYDIHLSAKTGPGGYGWFVDSNETLTNDQQTLLLELVETSSKQVITLDDIAQRVQLNELKNVG